MALQLLFVALSLAALPSITHQGWKLSNNAHRDGDRVVLTDDAPSQHGLLFHPERQILSSFRLRLNYTITGSPKETIVGDGLGLFLTNTRPEPGVALGFAPRWRGVAVLLDTYQNRHKTPTVQLAFNDGHNVYNPAVDGADLPSRGCFLATARGVDQVLELTFDNDQFAVALNGERCAVLSSHFDPGFFVSVAAQTGEVYEAHIVNSIELLPLRSVTRHAAPSSFAKALKANPVELKFTALELPSDPHGKLQQIYKALWDVDEATALARVLAKKRAEVFDVIAKDFAGIPGTGVSRRRIDEMLEEATSFYSAVYDLFDESLLLTTELIEEVQDVALDGSFFEFGQLGLVDYVLFLNGVILCVVFAWGLFTTKRRW